MSDEQATFFSRFYNCGKINLTPKNKEVSNYCSPDKKSFVASLFERKKKNDEIETPCGETKIEKKDESTGCPEVKPPCPKKKKCPDVSSKPYCFIKEQNPLAVCCEKPKKMKPPCPPEGYPQDPRRPSCGCDRCRKSGYHGRCCDRRTYVHGPDDPLELEKA